MKKCYRCKIEKPFSEYHKNRTKKDGLTTYCRECHNQYIREMTRNEADETRSKRLQRRNSQKRAQRFGISQEQYEQMKKAQNHTCAICGMTNSFNKDLAVDHCHATGKVRGLLCFSCNTGLGKFQDDPILLEKAMRYLDQARL